MTHRQRRRLAELVRQYLESIDNDTQRLVCFLIMRGCTEEDICRDLHITQERLELVKMTTAIEMRNFGLAPEDWKERNDA